MGAEDTMSLYGGSRLLQPLADVLGFPVDQINFISGHLIGLGLSYFYRKHLDNDDVSPTVRHIFNIVTGVLLAIFCFGWEVWYIVAQALACYVAMKITPETSVHRSMMTIAMGLMSYNHVIRTVAGNGEAFIDVSGSLMVCTQKLTSLGWSLHDGGRDADKLSPEHRRLAVRKQPSFLEFWSYVFYFQAILVGPLCFYADYRVFVEGHFRGKDVRPSPAWTVAKKMGCAVVAMAMIVFVVPLFAPEKNIDPRFIAESSLLYRVLFIVVSLFGMRQKYYFAWMIGEAVCNMSGLGYNGLDPQGRHRWDLVDNINIIGVEKSNSPKAFLDAWNINTGRWLRLVAYTRAPPRFAALLTFCLSAFWHGFYPGYYFCSIFMGALVAAGKQMRRRIRHHFLSPPLKTGYDVVTWVVSQVFIAYCCLPAALLTFKSCVALYNSYFWSLHVITLTVLMAATVWPVPRITSVAKDQKTE